LRALQWLRRELSLGGGSLSRHAMRGLRLAGANEARRRLVRRGAAADGAYEALGACDLFLSIGTSGTVYPAAGFVFEAKTAGAYAVELNLEPSEGVDQFDERLHGPATAVVPAYVERLLAG
jgi:NAD-dependent SIR2 family protein deacetylase